MTDIPDLNSYYMVHAAMRRGSAQLAEALAGLPDESARFDADRLDAIRWYTNGLLEELRSHHLTEDELFFPALAARVPAFAEYETGLATDHVRLDDLMGVLRASVGELADGRDWHVNLTWAIDSSAELAHLLDEHLATEDADVLPLFARHFDAAEYEALDREAIRRAGLRPLFFTVPWAVTTADPAAASHLLATAPAMIRVVWRFTRRRYTRLAALALGTEVSAVVR